MKYHYEALQERIVEYEKKMDKMKVAAIAESRSLRNRIRELESRLHDEVMDIAPGSSLPTSSLVYDSSSASAANEVGKLKKMLEEERREFTDIIHSQNQSAEESKSELRAQLGFMGKKLCQIIMSTDILLHFFPFTICFIFLDSTRAFKSARRAS